jgi:predicted GNAT family acetyltransferase
LGDAYARHVSSWLPDDFRIRDRYAGNFRCDTDCFTSVTTRGKRTVEIRHDEAASRYEALDGAIVVGRIDYSEDAGRLLFEHTLVPPEHEGQGIAEQLTAGALDDVRARGRTVVPLCSFTASFFRRHPEYADVQA